ncbi:MAG: bidirectional hydrogenase complex protein HoxU [Tepidisphaeraceae bacterium]|jgi:bidirectional [NiFe] hydrogenase diaphorase subunit
MTASTTVVTLKIDGKDLGSRADETILDVCKENKIHIPTLCFLEGLSGWGACRLCLVEVKGMNKLLPACVTKVAEGMEVTTNSPRLQAYRRMIVQMLFSERNHVCSVCVSNGHCELQNLAKEMEITHLDIPYRYPKLPFDSSHDLFRLDHNRCVLCTRCVRVCDEIEGAHTWDVAGRGVESRVIIDLDQPWADSQSCTGCGKCVRICPTGALTRKGTGVAEMEKDDDFLPYLTQMRGNRT